MVEVVEGWETDSDMLMGGGDRVYERKLALRRIHGFLYKSVFGLYLL